MNRRRTLAHSPLSAARPPGPGDLTSGRTDRHTWRRWWWRWRRRHERALLVALAVATLWRSALPDAGSAEEATDPTVVVASAPVEAGALIPAEALARRATPAESTPPDAVIRLDDAAGHRATTDLAAGEVVRASRIGPQGATEIAARLGPDRRALPVALAVAVPGLAEGQRLDLLSPAGPGPDGVTPGRATVVASDAAVIGIGEDPTVVVVDVAGDDAPALADALGVGPVVPSLRPATDATAVPAQRS